MLASICVKDGGRAVGQLPPPNSGKKLNKSVKTAENSRKEKVRKNNK